MEQSMNPEIPSPVHNSHLGLIVGAVVLLIVGGIVGYVMGKSDAEPKVSPTPTSTPTVTTSPEVSDWKTYKNSQYGFELEYPAMWQEPTMENTRIYLGIMEKEACEGVDCRTHVISVLPAQDAQVFLRDLMNGKTMYGTLVENIHEDNISGAPSVIFDAGGICEFAVAYIFGQKNTVVFEGRCMLTKDPIFNHILSTFKFIK